MVESIDIVPINNHFLSFYYRPDTNDSDVVRSIMQDEYYVLDIERGGLCIDIGAHIGAMTVLAGSYLEMTVHSYEPCRENVRLLQKNIELNDVNAKVFHAAVSESASTKMGYTDNAIHHYITNSTSRYKPFEVEGIHLNDILVQPIKLLKIDAEGAEHLFFRVPEDLICNAEYITGEYHAKHGVSFEQFLSIFSRTHHRLPTCHNHNFRLKKQ